MLSVKINIILGKRNMVYIISPFTFVRYRKFGKGYIEN